MSVTNKRIEEFAYYIWESEGRPHGHEARHWEMATKLAEAEDKAPAVLPKKAPKNPLDSGGDLTGQPSAPKPKAGKAASKVNGEAEPAPKVAASKAAPKATPKAAPKAEPASASAAKKPRAPRKPTAQ